MQKQWLVFHTCTRLGYQHRHQLTLPEIQLVCLAATVSLLRVSGLRPFHKTFLTSLLPTGMQMKIIFSSASQTTDLYSSTIPHSSHPFPAGDRSCQGLWTEQELDMEPQGAERAGAGAPQLCLLRCQWTQGAAEEIIITGKERIQTGRKLQERRLKQLLCSLRCY